MKPLDLTSTLFAAGIAGVLSYLLFGRTKKSFLLGLLVGAAVQTSVRVTGIS